MALRWESFVAAGEKQKSAQKEKRTPIIITHWKSPQQLPPRWKLQLKFSAVSPAAHFLCGGLGLISAIWLDVAKRPLLPVWMIWMMKMMMRPVSADGCTEPCPPWLHSTSPITLHASTLRLLQGSLQTRLKINKLSLARLHHRIDYFLLSAQHLNTRAGLNKLYNYIILFI